MRSGLDEVECSRTKPQILVPKPDISVQFFGYFEDKALRVEVFGDVDTTVSGGGLVSRSITPRSWFKGLVRLEGFGFGYHDPNYPQH